MPKFSGGNLTLLLCVNAIPSQGFKQEPVLSVQMLRGAARQSRQVNTCHAEDSVCGPGEQAVAASCIPLSWALMGLSVVFSIGPSDPRRHLTNPALCQAFPKTMLHCRRQRYKCNSKGASSQVAHANTHAHTHTHTLASSSFDQ